MRAEGRWREDGGRWGRKEWRAHDGGCMDGVSTASLGEGGYCEGTKKALTDN